MTIEQAITKASTDGRWKDGHVWGLEGERVILIDDLGNRVGALSFHEALLDPAFWQSLGKALGWDEGALTSPTYKGGWMWRHQWHRFIDHLADGGTPDSYFALTGNPRP